MKQKKAPVHPEVAIQSLLRPDLTPVSANKDYEHFRSTIENVDRILVTADLERYAIDFGLENLRDVAPQADEQAMARQAEQAARPKRESPSCAKNREDACGKKGLKTGR